MLLLHRESVVPPSKKKLHVQVILKIKAGDSERLRIFFKKKALKSEQMPLETTVERHFH